TIDLSGRGFVLLTGPQGEEWVKAAAQMASSFGGLTLDAYCVGRDLEDPAQAFVRAFGISDCGASLVRPDGFVAWRTSASPAGSHSALQEAVSRSLGLQKAA